jgi:hypothetical protein
MLIEIDSKEWHDVSYCIQQRMSASHIKKVEQCEKNDVFKTKLALENNFHLIRIKELNEKVMQKVIDYIKNVMPHENYVGTDFYFYRKSI